VLGLRERIRNAWRTRGRRLDAKAIERASVAQEAAERERHRATSLEPGRSNTDWTYIPPD
jgi:hypothetical protein